MSKTKVLKNGERIKSLFVSFAFFQKYMQAYNAQQYTCLDPLLIFWRSSRGNFIKLIRRDRQAMDISNTTLTKQTFEYSK